MLIWSPNVVFFHCGSSPQGPSLFWFFLVDLFLQTCRLSFRQGLLVARLLEGKPHERLLEVTIKSPGLSLL